MNVIKLVKRKWMKEMTRPNGQQVTVPSNTSPGVIRLKQ